LAAKLDTEFAGFQKDPLPFYAAADIFINPSLGPEGSSLVALDAMARGVPCLLSDLPVFQEISDEGRAALLFRTGDVDDLRTKLLALLQDDRLRHKYAKAGYAAVLRRHSSETAQNQYLTAFGIQGCSRA
jgi:glycosyltransferase involved in cell wall biosynthesis